MAKPRRCVICNKEFNGCVRCLKNTSISKVDFSKYEQYRVANNLTEGQLYNYHENYLGVCDEFKHYLMFLSIKEYLGGRKNKASLMEDVALLNITVGEINTFKDSIKEILLDKDVKAAEAPEEITEFAPPVQEEVDAEVVKAEERSKKYKSKNAVFSKE